MRYVSDNVLATVNGEKRRIGLAVSEGHLIGFFRKSGFLDSIITGSAAMTGAALGGAVLPVAGAMLIAAKLIEKRQQDSLAQDYQKIRTKFNLKDEDIFVSNSDRSTVSLSGGSFLTFGNTKIDVQGQFARGDQLEDMFLHLEFSESKPSVAKTFESSGFPVCIN